MDYHQNARLTVHSREQMAKMVVEQGCTQQAAALTFHVSAKTAGKWVRRYRQSGAASLADLSSRPHHSPRQTTSTSLEKVFALRRLRWNASISPSNPHRAPASQLGRGLPAVAAYLAEDSGSGPHESGGDPRRTHAQPQLRLNQGPFLCLQMNVASCHMQPSPVSEMLHLYLESAPSHPRQ